MPMRRVALIQFDAHPEDPRRNLTEMERLVREAASQGARWVLFHEGTLCDYTTRLTDFAETVPDGPACKRIERLSGELRCFVSFGLAERDGDRFYITQVFQSPAGSLCRYRKTWLWRQPDDQGYRDEWARYDPGTGPELFDMDGARAACFICADGDSHRCIERAAALKPQVVFYPNNRASLPELPVFGNIARRIGAPMLVTNRVGRSWCHECTGGCAVYSGSGEVLAAANREGREEILLHDLHV